MSGPELVILLPDSIQILLDLVTKLPKSGHFSTFNDEDDVRVVDVQEESADVIREVSDVVDIAGS